MNRAGVEPGKPTLALASVIAAGANLELVGLMTWEAHAVAIGDPSKKAKVVADAITPLLATAQACRQAGHTISMISCGGTGTFPYCVQQPGVTEVEVGGAIFSDMRYRTKYHVDFPFALTMLTTVTSRPTERRIVVDAGKKAMSSDAAMPSPIGLSEIAEMRFSAEHTTIDLTLPSEAPHVADQLELIVGYSDTTIHLHERILGMRAGRVECIWPVEARGKLQ